jgi:hypothetical protein
MNWPAFLGAGFLPGVLLFVVWRLWRRQARLALATVEDMRALGARMLALESRASDLLDAARFHGGEIARVDLQGATGRAGLERAIAALRKDLEQHRAGSRHRKAKPIIEGLIDAAPEGEP